MDKCWWCVWYIRGKCCVDLPVRTAIPKDGWCKRFAGVADSVFERRLKLYGEAV